MRIASEDANSLVATDKAIGKLLLEILLAGAGIGIIALGLSSHTQSTIIIGVLALAIGVLSTLLHKQRTLTVDKPARQVKVRIKSILKTSERSYPIADIAKLRLAASYQTVSAGANLASQPGLSVNSLGLSQTKTRTSLRTRLLFVLNDGSSITLAKSRRSLQLFDFLGSAPNQKVGERIAAAIGVPFEAVGL